MNARDIYTVWFQFHSSSSARRHSFVSSVVVAKLCCTCLGSAFQCIVLYVHFSTVEYVPGHSLDTPSGIVSVGTYELDSATGDRKGSLKLFSIADALKVHREHSHTPWLP